MLDFKISLDLLKGLLSYGGFKLPPNFQRLVAAKLCVRPPKVFEVQERAQGPLSPCQVWWARISPATGAAKTLRFFVCLLVCLFVMLLNVRDCAPDFAMKALEYRNDFDTVG